MNKDEQRLHIQNTIIRELIQESCENPMDWVEKNAEKYSREIDRLIRLGTAPFEIKERVQEILNKKVSVVY